MPRVAEREVKVPTPKVDPKRAAIWERRFLNPGQETSQPIAMKEQGWTTRWINTQMPGRFHQSVSSDGYEPVKKDDLEHELDLLGLVDMGDGLVRRGEKGVEVLMKIPTNIFKRIQKRKAELTMQGLRKSRQALAENIARKHGADAGDFVEGKSVADGIGGLKGNIVDSLEKVPFSEANE